MSKKTLLNVFTIVLLSIISLIVIAFIAIAISIWYEFFDVTGLTFYKDQKISEIYMNGKRYILVDEDGNGYVMGEHSSSSNRKYLNAEFYNNKKLDAPTPVLFYEGEYGKIRQVYFYNNVGTLMITEDGSLLKCSTINYEKIYDGVKSVAYEDLCGIVYYIVKNDGTLISMTENFEETVICDNVKMVDSYTGTLYVLKNNGELYIYTDYLDKGISDQKPDFENVSEFTVSDTKQRSYSGGTFWLSYCENLETLINVLTNDGKLYARGTYNLRLLGFAYASNDASVYSLSEWTLLGENVTDYSVCTGATVFVTEDGKAHYYGFDMNKHNYNDYNSVIFTPQIVSYCFDIDGVKNVMASKSYALAFFIQTEDKLYYWAENTSDMRRLFDVYNYPPYNKPFVIDNG